MSEQPRSSEKPSMRSPGDLLAEVWDQVSTLSHYGTDPGTVGWWRGQSYVLLWDWRTGSKQWRPFNSSRPEQPPKPKRWNCVFYEYAKYGRRLKENERG